MTIATLKSSSNNTNYYLVEGEIGVFWAQTCAENDYIHIEAKNGKRVPAQQRREILPIIQQAIGRGR